MMEIEDQARIRWRCRRGLKELDLLLMPFVEQKYLQLTKAEKQTFLELLESPDPEIYSWLIGYSCPLNANWRSLCEQIREFHQHQH